MRKAILVSITALSFSTAVLAQSPAPSPIEGVWRVAEVVTTGANASTVGNPQPSLIVFTRGYYSYMSVDGAGPRPKFASARNPRRLTDAEKVARYEQWENFTANAGTYEVKGSTLTRRPMVAKNETVMTTNPPLVAEFTIEGDTLWLTSRSAPGDPASGTRTKLTRLE